jgi:hypothetical protein
MFRITTAALRLRQSEYSRLGQLCTVPKEPETNFGFDAGLLFCEVTTASDRIERYSHSEPHVASSMDST